MSVKSPPYDHHTVPCPLCGGTAHSSVADRDRKGAPLPTVLCQDCGHVFTNPQPTAAALEAFYGRRYRQDYKGVTTPKLKHVYRAGLRALERLKRMRPYVKAGGRVIDVGSGGGEFVYLLSKAGYESAGIEPNQGYAAYARDEYGIPIDTATLDTALDPDNAADLITLHHVVEHLADPVAALTRLRGWLADDGHMIIEVPNIEARYHAPGRRFHFAHLQSFSADGLRLLAGKSGFRLADLTVQPHTGHLNAVLIPGGGAPLPDPAAAKRISHALQTESGRVDALTPRPYKRLWANLKRPFKERLALAALGSPSRGRDVLDRLYTSAD